MERDALRRYAHVLTLIIAAGLLVATSQSGPPGSQIAHKSGIPAGQRSATATVDVELPRGDFADVARPFTATIDVSSASLPAADGSPAAAATIETAVRVDGDVETAVRVDGSDAYPDGKVPPAGSCDAERCHIRYVLEFALARPAETDVLVSWKMRIDGREELAGTLDVTVDRAATVEAPGTQSLTNGTIAIRLDRVADADAHVDLINGGEQHIIVDLPDTEVTVPAGASARLTTFARCDRPVCTVHARLDKQLENGALVLDGPVVATDIIARRSSVPVGAPRIRSAPVTRSVRLTSEAATDWLQLAIDGNAASGLSAGGPDVEPQLSVRVRMRLTHAADGTVVRYRPEDGTEPIVLSAAAGPGDSETITVDVSRHLAITPELISGQAQAHVTAEVIAAYPGGIADGAKVTAAFVD